MPITHTRAAIPAYRTRRPATTRALARLALGGYGTAAGTGRSRHRGWHWTVTAPRSGPGGYDMGRPTGPGHPSAPASGMAPERCGPGRRCGMARATPSGTSHVRMVLGRDRVRGPET